MILAFIEGVLRPNLPAAFVIGMNNARPCSWTERVFAGAVWSFNHVGNCVRAHDVPCAPATAVQVPIRFLK